MKSIRKPRRGAAWELLIACALFLALIWASSGRSDGSESHEIPETPQSGPERVRILERPSKANPDITTQKGWVGNKRIDLKVIRTNEYTKITGWIDGERVDVKERKE